MQHLPGLQLHPNLPPPSLQHHHILRIPRDTLPPQPEYHVRVTRPKHRVSRPHQNPLLPISPVPWCATTTTKNATPITVQTTTHQESRRRKVETNKSDHRADIADARAQQRDDGQADKIENLANS
jgi:hypothetical protein